MESSSRALFSARVQEAYSNLSKKLIFWMKIIVSTANIKFEQIKKKIEIKSSIENVRRYIIIMKRMQLWEIDLNARKLN